MLAAAALLSCGAGPSPGRPADQRASYLGAWSGHERESPGEGGPAALAPAAAPDIRRGPGGDAFSAARRAGSNAITFKPIEAGGAWWDPANLQTLCAWRCHLGKSRRERSRAMRTPGPGESAWQDLVDSRLSTP